MFQSLLQNVSLIRLLVFTHIGFVAAELQCYNPDGSANDQDSPCDPGAEVTHCCSSESICLSNKLCWQQTYANLNQGSCTDSKWESSECFQNSQGNGPMCKLRKSFLSDLVSNNPHSPQYPHPSSTSQITILIQKTKLIPSPADTYIFVCQQTGGLEFYCDNEDSIQCTNDSSTPTFSIGSAFLADFRNSSSAVQSVVYSTYTDTVTSTPTPSANIHNNPGDSTTATITLTEVVTVPLPGATGAVNAASSLIPKAQCPSHAAEKAGIGAGVGVPLAAALAAALGFGFWERRKRRRVEEDFRGGEKDEGRGIAGDWGQGEWDYGRG
ncbi:hypothetical protein G7Y79_00013g034770 [Physcia stellaris]|nr:hypothetical protein G7Y79_00013g034770 [Physcia stellaris]